MKEPKKENLRKLLERVKKDASVFLSSEEGKILKKDIVKAAVTLGIVASQIWQSDQAISRGGHGSFPVSHWNRGIHSNVYGSHWNRGRHTNIVPPHTNVAHSDSGHVDSAQQILHNDAGSNGHNSAHINSAHADVAHSNF